jgi:hypothetical protein
MVASTRSLADLITEIRGRSDQQNALFVTDSELEVWINQSAAELWDVIIDHAGADAFASLHSFSTVAGTDIYAMPADFYRLTGVDVQFSGRWRRIDPHPIGERNLFEGGNDGWTSPRDTRYRLSGRTTAGVQQLRFVPTPQAVASVRAWYVPLAYTGAASLVSINGWDEFVVADVCAKIFESEESDARAAIARREGARERVIRAASSLDMGEPAQMRDVADYRDDYEPIWRG